MIVSVIDNQVRFSLAQKHGLAAGAEPPFVRREYCGSAALQHRHAGAIDIRASDRLRATNNSPVSALYAPATQVERYEEIIEAAAMHDERRFNRLPVSGQTRRIGLSICRAHAARQRIDFCI